MASASGNWNALGDWDLHAVPFSTEELEVAIEWRQRHAHMTPKRRDHCPHAARCESVPDCLEKIAWYFRHRRVIEQRSA